MALTAMAEVGIDSVDAVGLAKMRVQAAPRSSEIERSEERVFLPGQSNPVILKHNSNALFLLQRVRDEAHRFAITHHRKLRSQPDTLFGARSHSGCRRRAQTGAAARLRQRQTDRRGDSRRTPQSSLDQSSNWLKRSCKRYTQRSKSSLWLRRWGRWAMRRELLSIPPRG